MSQKMLEIREIDGKYLVIEYKIKEKEYSLGLETPLRTNHYLSFFQWHIIEQSLLEFAKNNVDELERKTEKSTVNKLFIQDNILLTIRLKNTNISHYICIMKSDPEKTYQCRLEVQIEIIEQNILNRTITNGNNCKVKTSGTKLMNNSPPSEPHIGRSLRSVHTNNVELYLPTPTKSKISPLTYTPKSMAKEENEASGDEAYIPQSVGKAVTLSTSYTATKLSDVIDKPKRNKVADGVAELSSQENETRSTSRKKILFGNDSDLEENKDETYAQDAKRICLTTLSEKYATMKLPEIKKKGFKVESPKMNLKKKQSRTKDVYIAPISGWMTTKNSKPNPSKRKLTSSSVDDASKTKIMALKIQEENLRKKNRELCEINEKYLSKITKTELVEPHIHRMLKLTNYSTEILDEKYQRLFKDKAHQYFKEHENTHKCPTSKYYLAYIDFTPNDLINEMLEFLQTEFGRDDDMGKFTDLFTSLLCPQFAYELFKAEFSMNDEQAERQLKWQDQVNAGSMISPIKSD